MSRHTRTCDRCQEGFTTYGAVMHSRCISCRRAKTSSTVRNCPDCGSEISVRRQRCAPCAENRVQMRSSARTAAKANGVISRQVAMVGCEGCGKPTARGSLLRRHIHCPECEAFQAAWAKDAWRNPFIWLTKLLSKADRKRKSQEPVRRQRQNAHEVAWRRRLRALEKAESEPWLHPDLTPAEKARVRRQLDPRTIIYERTKRRLRKKGCNSHFLKQMRRGVLSSTGRAGRGIEGALGYTMADLKTHLERQFVRGMTWERFKAGDIHIDHVRPLNTFDHTDPEEARAAWALTNLRPLWALDNLKRPRDGSDVLI